MTLFPLIREDNVESRSIKWKISTASYEAHLGRLNNIDTAEVIEHVHDTMHAVVQAVTTTAHIGQSLFKIFPRTLSTPLTSIWDALLTDVLHAGVSQTSKEGFEHFAKAFIASHAAMEERYEAVQQLRGYTKPVQMRVQAFYYRLREINGYIRWMPGQEAPLDDTQLKQSFYDGMPTAWKNRFTGTGRSPSATPLSSLLQFFRQQERTAQENERANNQKQLHTSRVEKRKKPGKKTRQEALRKRGRSQDGPEKPTRINDDAQCPVHPHSNHKWGECFANAYRAKDGKAKSPSNHGKEGKTGKPKAKDSFAVAISTTSQSSQAEKAVSFEETWSEDANSTSSVVNNDSKKSESFTLQTATVHNILHTNVHSIDLFDPNFQSNYDTQYLSEMEMYMSEMNEAYLSGDAKLSNADINLETNVSQRVKPISLALVTTIQGVQSKRPLAVLFDTGSETTLIARKALPTGCNPKRSKTLSLRGIGRTETSHKVHLEKVRFPEFSPTQCVDKPISAHVVPNLGPYDIVLGTDVMSPLGFDTHCSSKTVSWMNNRIPWKSPDDFEPEKENDSFSTSCYYADTPYVSNYENIANVFALRRPRDEIKSSKYELASPDEVASQQQHLTPLQRKDLSKLLSNFGDLFNGTLVHTGRLPKFRKKVSLDLLPESQAFHSRPYPVPERHKAVFKEELERLVEIGVLSRCGPSEWLAPTFIIPKKDGRVRWVSDFRALNKCIKRKVYTIPRIHDILKKRSGYQYFTKLDISMQFYTFELDEASKELCTICTPFGNYRYNRLPMGIKQSPDIAQEAMEDLLRSIEDVDVYIDDVGVFSNSWDDHLKTLDKVLTTLQNENFTINPLKCEWGVQETDWLGYWLTPHGLKPWKKKIDAILALSRPTTISELRSFIGAVTFYRDMFPKRSHILAPLTAQVGKKKLEWTPQCQQAFDQAKAMLAKDVFVHYPDHNRPFHVYCDASDRQLGAAIFQDGKPVAYYSRKLNSAQRNYTVGEKEILSIVETLKEYRSMLYGCKELHVYTDHKNLTFNKLTTQRVMRWRMFLEDYAPIFHYIKGEENTLADALSRLPITERQSTDSQRIKNPNDLYRSIVSQGIENSNDRRRSIVLDSVKEENANKYNQTSLRNPISFYSMAIDDPDLIDCFVHLPAQQGLNLSLDYESIAEAQERDAVLQAAAENDPQRYVRQLLAPDTLVWCYISAPGRPWKIYLPSELLENAINWYHLALSHIGGSRLYDTMNMHYYNPALKTRIEDIVQRCDTCQRMKLVGRGHGQLAPKEAPLLPWREVAVDLIGPWEIDIADTKVSFRALTIIDPVTNLTEIVRIQNKSAAHVAQLFEQAWLARYPMPQDIIYDQGTEFTGQHFQQMCHRNNITTHPISSKNPQANAVCERMHQTVGNSLRTLQTLNPPAGIQEAASLVDAAIAEAIFAHRASYSEALGSTPGAVAFGRDMILNIPVIADLISIRNRRQHLIDERLIKANRRRFAYDYAVGEQVLKLVYKPNKLQPRAEGPYPITRVHTNGTVTIRISPQVIERINIRRVKPYRQ